MCLRPVFICENVQPHPASKWDSVFNWGSAFNGSFTVYNSCFCNTHS